MLPLQKQKREREGGNQLQTERVLNWLCWASPTRNFPYTPSILKKKLPLATQTNTINLSIGLPSGPNEIWELTPWNARTPVISVKANWRSLPTMELFLARAMLHP